MTCIFNKGKNLHAFTTPKDPRNLKILTVTTLEFTLNSNFKIMYSFFHDILIFLFNIIMYKQQQQKRAVLQLIWSLTLQIKFLNTL